MATRYIIGQGESLTYPIDPPKIKPNKVHPYTLEEARAAVVPQIRETAERFKRLPVDARPGGLVVAKLVLHPSYVAKSYYPAELLRDVGLISVGSKTIRVRPRTNIRAKSPEMLDTTELFVAGSQAAFDYIESYTDSLVPNSETAIQFAEIETFDAMLPSDRIRAGGESGGYFEVGLHLMPGVAPDLIQAPFTAYAKKMGFDVFDGLSFRAGNLLFLPVEGDQELLDQLAEFSMIRVLRPMPRIRSARPPMRSASLGLGFALPSGEPMSREPKVAILDGGLPSEHVLHPYINRYFHSDAEAQDVPAYLDHGLGVTSAFLFGPIKPGQEAARPYAYIDHYRVLDSVGDTENPLELYRTLANIEWVLLSRQYQFINLSLGPDLPCEDNDVHAWTSVIDELLSDGETLMTVAAGNNGERDEALGFDRIQVPADSVNALAVGATDVRNDGTWERAIYSARGPGRSPGRRKPDVVAFGGSGEEYFHVAVSGRAPEVAATLGTSFASPLTLRAAAGIAAILGNEVHPLTTKALLIHSCERRDGQEYDDVGWGRIPTDLADIITCEDGVARIIYQGVLKPGKYMRAPVPLPPYQMDGNVELSATFCYASPVDPQDASAYTKAGLDIKFRPHEDKIKDGASQPTTATFFPSADWRSEQELRADLMKWETVLHATNTFRGTSLKGTAFDIHYNARSGAANARSDAALIRYALVITLRSKKNAKLYDDILATHSRLKALESRLSVPVRIRGF
jgi:hypothetical protein